MNKQNLTNIDYFESRERYAIQQLYAIHIKPIMEHHYNCELHLSSTFRQSIKATESFDAVIYLRDKITLRIIYKFIIEVKYRDSEYETLMLEKKKHKALLNDLKKAEQFKGVEEDIAILYINFCPSGTYIFNLSSDKLIDFLKDNKNKATVKQVRTTFIADDAKIDKDIYYLPKSLAKHYPLVVESDYALIYNISKTQKIEDKKQPVKTYSLF